MTRYDAPRRYRQPDRHVIGPIDTQAVAACLDASSPPPDGLAMLDRAIAAVRDVLADTQIELTRRGAA